MTKCEIYLLLFLGICSVKKSFGIQCFECGSLPSITGLDENCVNGMDVKDKCTYDLGASTNTGFLEAVKDGEITANLSAVCYTLTGRFREDKLVMRGCDALPLPERWDYPCYTPDFPVWFETEVGKELILSPRICICTTDFCTTYVDDSAHVFQISYSILLIMVFMTVYVS